MYCPAPSSSGAGFLGDSEFVEIASHPYCKIAADEDIYKEGHLVECCFNKLKHFRRIATRYEKTARNFLAIITVAAIVLWLR